MPADSSTAIDNVFDDNEAVGLFEAFCKAETFKAIVLSFKRLVSILELHPCDPRDFYRRIRSRLTFWQAKQLWAKLDKRAALPEYRSNRDSESTCRVLIIGAGPCGLRTAIECAFLGAHVLVLEKRTKFSRNNVLHLWPYLIKDLNALGAKKFFPKFCSGSVDHISIRRLQCILLKIALLVGVQLHAGVEYVGLREPSGTKGWTAKLKPDHLASLFEFDVIVAADGKRNTLPGFKRKEFRGKLAIAITANFINFHSAAEADVSEICGVAYIFNQEFFNTLRNETGIDLENIVYYKDDTHYFVMTAKKTSLLAKGVLRQDFADVNALLSSGNVDHTALLAYATEAADFSTHYKLPRLEFALNASAQPDVAMFDFTSRYAAQNASRYVSRGGHTLLAALVGDSLVEPFWPMGTGCARGFFGAFDLAWMIRGWKHLGGSPLELLAERESVYQLLSQTDTENTHKNIASYTINPVTRYTNLNSRYFKPHQVKSLLDTDGLHGAPPLRGALPQYDLLIESDGLLDWCRRKLTGYEVTSPGNLGADWRDGKALSCLVHRFLPQASKSAIHIESILSVIDTALPTQVSPATVKWAMDVAASHLQIGTDHMVAELLTSSAASDDPFLLTPYLKLFYERFRRQRGITAPGQQHHQKHRSTPRRRSSGKQTSEVAPKTRRRSHRQTPDQAEVASPEGVGRNGGTPSTSSSEQRKERMGSSADLEERRRLIQQLYNEKFLGAHPPTAESASSDPLAPPQDEQLQRAEAFLRGRALLEAWGREPDIEIGGQGHPGPASTESQMRRDRLEALLSQAKAESSKPSKPTIPPNEKSRIGVDERAARLLTAQQKEWERRGPNEAMLAMQHEINRGGADPNRASWDELCSQWQKTFGDDFAAITSIGRPADWHIADGIARERQGALLEAIMSAQEHSSPAPQPADLPSADTAKKAMQKYRSALTEMEKAPSPSVPPSRIAAGAAALTKANIDLMESGGQKLSSQKEIDAQRFLKLTGRLLESGNLGNLEVGEKGRNRVSALAERLAEGSGSFAASPMHSRLADRPLVGSNADFGGDFCFMCKRRIPDHEQPISARGLQLHARCLKCCHCEKQITECEFYSVDRVKGKFYCALHAHFNTSEASQTKQLAREKQVRPARDDVAVLPQKTTADSESVTPVPAHQTNGVAKRIDPTKNMAPRFPSSTVTVEQRRVSKRKPRTAVIPKKPISDDEQSLCEFNLRASATFRKDARMSPTANVYSDEDSADDASDEASGEDDGSDADSSSTISDGDAADRTSPNHVPAAAYWERGNAAIELPSPSPNQNGGSVTRPPSLVDWSRDKLQYAPTSLAHTEAASEDRSRREQDTSALVTESGPTVDSTEVTKVNPSRKVSMAKKAGFFSQPTQPIRLDPHRLFSQPKSAPITNLPQSVPEHDQNQQTPTDPLSPCADLSIDASILNRYESGADNGDVSLSSVLGANITHTSDDVSPGANSLETTLSTTNRPEILSVQTDYDSEMALNANQSLTSGAGSTFVSQQQPSPGLGDLHSMSAGDREKSANILDRGFVARPRDRASYTPPHEDAAIVPERPSSHADIPSVTPTSSARDSQKLSILQGDNFLSHTHNKASAVSSPGALNDATKRTPASQATGTQSGSAFDIKVPIAKTDTTSEEEEGIDNQSPSSGAVTSKEAGVALVRRKKRPTRRAKHPSRSHRSDKAAAAAPSSSADEMISDSANEEPKESTPVPADPKTPLTPGFGAFVSCDRKSDISRISSGSMAPCVTPSGVQTASDTDSSEQKRVVRASPKSLFDPDWYQDHLVGNDRFEKLRDLSVSKKASKFSANDIVVPPDIAALMTTERSDCTADLSKESEAMTISSSHEDSVHGCDIPLADDENVTSPDLAPRRVVSLGKELTDTNAPSSITPPPDSKCVEGPSARDDGSLVDKKFKSVFEEKRARAKQRAELRKRSKESSLKLRPLGALGGAETVGTDSDAAAETPSARRKKDLSHGHAAAAQPGGHTNLHAKHDTPLAQPEPSLVRPCSDCKNATCSCACGPTAAIKGAALVGLSRQAHHEPPTSPDDSAVSPTKAHPGERGEGDRLHPCESQDGHAAGGGRVQRRVAGASPNLRKGAQCFSLDENMLDNSQLKHHSGFHRTRYPGLVASQSFDQSESPGFELDTTQLSLLCNLPETDIGDASSENQSSGSGLNAELKKKSSPFKRVFKYFRKPSQKRASMPSTRPEIRKSASVDTIFRESPTTGEAPPFPDLVTASAEKPRVSKSDVSCRKDELELSPPGASGVVNKEKKKSIVPQFLSRKVKERDIERAAAAVDESIHISVAAPPLDTPLTAPPLLQTTEALSENDLLCVEEATVPALKASPSLVEGDGDRSLRRKAKRATKQKAKQMQMERLHKAQKIQQQIAETEVRSHEVSKRMDALQPELQHGKKGDAPYDRAAALWMQLVQEKKLLTRFDAELQLQRRQLALDERQSALDAAYRSLCADRQSRTSVDEQRQREVLKEMLQIIEERDAIVQQVEQLRVHDKDEDAHVEKVFKEKGVDIVAAPVALPE